MVSRDFTIFDFIFTIYFIQLIICVFSAACKLENISLAVWKYDIFVQLYGDSLEDMKFQLTFSCVLGEKQLDSGN